MTIELYNYRLEDIEKRIEAGHPIAGELVRALIAEIRSQREKMQAIREGRGTLQEVRLNEDGTLDEIVINDCYVHLEQMDKGAWWMGIGRGNSPYLMVNLTSKKKIHATWDDEGLGCTVTRRSPTDLEDTFAEGDAFHALLGDSPTPVTESEAEVGQ